jgi:hypothetical protein
MSRIQQLAGIKTINESFDSPEAIKRDVMSYEPEELKKWIMRYAESVSKGNWDNAEKLRIALNIIKKEGIKL